MQCAGICIDYGPSSVKRFPIVQTAIELCYNGEGAHGEGEAVGAGVGDKVERGATVETTFSLVLAHSPAWFDEGPFHLLPRLRRVTRE
jgi:hypothetical protein